MSPTLNLPPYNGSVVNVSIIHGGCLQGSTTFFTQTPVVGHDAWVDIPSHSFLVENDRTGKKVLFDLGLIKAWREKHSPIAAKLIAAVGLTIDITRDVADHLHDASVPLDSINSIIWSHYHFDHTGDPSLFPSTTSLIVGPGFKSNPQTFPGYPLNPDALVSQDAFEGREVLELEFNSGLEIGGLKALDFFGDGSFYLLQASGHTHDHICGLARTSEDKFIFLGGDAAHHNGLFRPTTLLPLPESISPSPFEGLRIPSFCPGSIFEHIHPATAQGEDYRTTPFYKLNPHLAESLEEANTTLEKIQVFDASPDVFVMIAHDIPAQAILPYFPGKLNGWETKGYKELNTWRFLGDFKKALEM